MNTIKRIFGFLIIAVTLTSCMVQKAATEVDEKAKSLVPPSEKALVYLFRATSFGGAIKFKVTCDDKFIGSTSGLRYIYTIQEPGKHTFISQAENRDELPIVLEANKTYYIEQTPKMGLIKARVDMSVVNENVGKQKLSKCKLSAENVEK